MMAFTASNGSDDDDGDDHLAWSCFIMRRIFGWSPRRDGMEWRKGCCLSWYYFDRSRRKRPQLAWLATSWKLHLQEANYCSERRWEVSGCLFVCSISFKQWKGLFSLSYPYSFSLSLSLSLYLTTANCALCRFPITAFARFSRPLLRARFYFILSSQLPIPWKLSSKVHHFKIGFWSRKTTTSNDFFLGFHLTDIHHLRLKVATKSWFYEPHSHLLRYLPIAFLVPNQKGKLKRERERETQAMVHIGIVFHRSLILRLYLSLKFE